MLKHFNTIKQKLSKIISFISVLSFMLKNVMHICTQITIQINNIIRKNIQIFYCETVLTQTQLTVIKSQVTGNGLDTKFYILEKILHFNRVNCLSSWKIQTTGSKLFSLILYYDCSFFFLWWVIMSFYLKELTIFTNRKYFM